MTLFSWEEKASRWQRLFRCGFSTVLFLFAAGIPLMSVNAGSSKVDLSPLSPKERVSIELSCSLSQVEGLDAYELCLKDEIERRGFSQIQFEQNRTPTRSIAKIQKALEELGYYSGAIDGILSQRTIEAINLFKKKNALASRTQIDDSFVDALKIKLRAYRAGKIQKNSSQTEQSLSPIDSGNSQLVVPTTTGSHLTTPMGPAQVYSKVKDSVWSVLSMNKPLEGMNENEEMSQGSAVAISGRVLLTNCHVVEDPKYTFIFRDDSEETIYPVRVLFQNRDADRCQLEVTKINLRPVKGIRLYKSLQIGEKVYAIGSPRSQTRTLSEGLVSGLRYRKATSQNLVQTSAPISHGSSGGGLFDSRGNLVGITTMIIEDSQNLGFAIAAEDFYSK